MYTQEQTAIFPVGTGVLAADSLTATGVHGEYITYNRIIVKRFHFTVTTAVVATTTAPVLRMLARPTPGSTTGQIELGRITVPDGTAVGKTMYKDIDMASVPRGYSLAFEVVTAGLGGTPAGAGQYGFESHLDPETPANEVNLVQSV